MSTINERVARGAALLDERVPGWHDRIDTDRLSVWSCRSCVLGQLYGDYYLGLPEIGLSLLDEATDHGFASMSADNGEYPELDAAWKVEITVRQAQDAATIAAKTELVSA